VTFNHLNLKGLILSGKQQSSLAIAVVGCGNWGKNLVRVFHELGVLHSVCDASSEKAQQFANQYQVDALSFDALLINPKIDGIAIAAPSHLHAALAKRCLEAGKHLFIEKPFALSHFEAEEINTMANAQNRTLMIGHLLQYHPAFVAIKETCQFGRLGKIQNIICERQNFNRFHTHENVLWDCAPHDLSMILTLMGQLPETVYAYGHQYLNPQVYDSATILLTFSNHCTAKISISWVHPYKQQKMMVCGEKAMLVFDDLQTPENKLQLLDIILPEHPQEAFQTHATTPLHYVASEPLKNECLHFLQAIEKQIKPISSGEEAIRVTQVCEAAMRSIALQMPVSVSSSSRNQNEDAKLEATLLAEEA